MGYFGNIELIYKISRIQTVVANAKTVVLRYPKSYYMNELRRIGFSDIERIIDYLYNAPYLASEEMDIYEIIVLAMKTQTVEFHSKQLALLGP